MSDFENNYLHFRAKSIFCEEKRYRDVEDVVPYSKVRSSLIFHICGANISHSHREYLTFAPRTFHSPLAKFTARAHSERTSTSSPTVCGLLVCSVSSRRAYYHVANGNISNSRSEYFKFAPRTFQSPLANFTARAPSRPPFSNIPRCQRQHFTFAPRIFHNCKAIISQIRQDLFHCASLHSHSYKSSAANVDGYFAIGSDIFLEHFACDERFYGRADEALEGARTVDGVKCGIDDKVLRAVK